MSQNQTLSFLRRRFDEVGLRIEPRYGQNFLIDLNLLRVIVDSAELTPDDVVLEVGTGVGSLTSRMAPLAAHVVTVEIDPRLHQLASEELIDFHNITMLQQDALKNKNTIAPEVLAAVNERLAESPERRFKLVANLPYNVATPLVSNLLSLDQPPDQMVVTVQKELADRMMAPPSTRDRSALSLWIQAQCDCELLRVLPPSVFWPRPKVHSAIIRLTVDHARRGAIEDREYFHRFVREIFLHRRKFLRGVLIAAYKKQLDKPAIDEVLTELGLEPTARAEELDVETMLRLAEAIRRRT